MNNKVPSVYIASSLRLLKTIVQVEEALRREGIVYYSPRDLVPSGTPKARMPEVVLKTCTEHIERADLVVVLLDYYGKDTAFEAGFAYSVGKKVIGLCTDSKAEESFAEDYMIRNSIALVVRSVEELTEEIKHRFFRVDRQKQRITIKSNS